jgi:antiviral helicase SKI2
LLDAKQRARVHDFCREAITRLSPEDRTLPQVERVIGLAEAGIGVHHGGMLPILKEVVEMLLADGLLKVLFCTSTFAMGINVPARTCCFAALRKFNGKEFVLLTPTEYVQMSGRAGRRGLDKVGTSIIICSKEIPEPDYLRQLLRGQGEALESQFRLRPNMILGLIRVQGIRMVDLLRRTLSANSVEAKIPEKLKELGEIEEALARFPKVDCVMGDIEEAIVPFAEKAGRMIEIMKRLDLGGEMKEAVAVGRIVLIIAQTIDVAVILHIATLRKISVRTAEGSPIMICADNICGFFDATLPDANSMAPPEIKRVLTPYRRRLPLRLSSVFKKVDPATLAGPSEEFAGLLREIWASPCYDCAQRDVHYGQARHRAEMEAKCKRLRNECASGQDAFLPLLNKHVQMLEQLHCISDGVITLKGRLALEMTTTAHELICAELILGNVFDDLAPDQLAGLTSCLLIEKAPKANEERVEVPESLQEQAEDIFAVVQEVADQMDECGIEFDEDTWSDTHFNPMGLRATMSWVNLRDFQTCVSQSSMTEGQLFRLLTSTATQLSCFAKAAMLIGNKGLADKFEETSTAMKRGIIFTPSLYLD